MKLGLSIHDTVGGVGLYVYAVLDVEAEDCGCHCGRRCSPGCGESDWNVYEVSEVLSIEECSLDGEETYQYGTELTSYEYDALVEWVLEWANDPKNAKHLNDEFVQSSALEDFARETFDEDRAHVGYWRSY